MADYGDDALKATDDHLRRCLAARRTPPPEHEGAESCHNCDAPIPAARRAAVPGCVLCVTCQAEEEQYGSGPV